MGVLDQSAWDLVASAEAEIDSLSVEDLKRTMTDDDVVVVDIRDIREVWIEGSIPDVEHAPRGMLEFWADPDTEYYREVFTPENRYVFYCNEGGRSALAAKRLKDIGYPRVAHLQGGFTAWKEAGCEVVDIPQKDYKNR